MFALKVGPYIIVHVCNVMRMCNVYILEGGPQIISSVLCNVSIILSSKVGDVMHAVFSQYKAAWLPQFERLLPKVTIQVA